VFATQLNAEFATTGLIWNPVCTEVRSIASLNSIVITADFKTPVAPLKGVTVIVGAVESTEKRGDCAVRDAPPASVTLTAIWTSAAVRPEGVHPYEVIPTWDDAITLFPALLV